jgi:hypothetical protein
MILSLPFIDTSNPAAPDCSAATGSAELLAGPTKLFTYSIYLLLASSCKKTNKNVRIIRHKTLLLNFYLR